MSGDAHDTFAGFAAEWLPAIERTLDALLPPAGEAPAVLHRGMRYAMFPGGKRLRPVLALAAARVTGGGIERALLPAAGLELLHTYSLVHDDLPCMDDDDLRRGRPTCHKAFGEANALLVGDALLTLAFEAVAAGGGAAVAALARAAGSRGMVGGQVADLAAEHGAAAEDAADPVGRLEWIHDRKTGALITASLEVGALAGGGEGCAALRRFGALIGRAFQIADDLLDVTGTAAELGKQPGQDAAHGKLTYPALLGVERSRAIARSLADEAVALAPSCATSGDPRDAALLADLAHYTIGRTR